MSEIKFENIIKEIEARLHSLITNHARSAEEVLMDDVDLRCLLKISRRTALEYRRKGIFPFYKLENKIFYILSEVINGIKTKSKSY